MESRARPPVAKRVPKRLVKHGDVRVDDYYWMRDRSDPDVMKHIEAENRYTERMMRHTLPLQNKLIKEMLSRTKEDDISVPEQVDDFFYYVRTVKGKQYPIHCRRKGSLKAKEETFLDINKEARGHEFFSVDQVKVSPDHNLVAYLVDIDGSERRVLRVKDLRTGRLLKDEITNTYSMEWANDSRTMFYATIDDVYRPHKVFRHVLGAGPKDDDLVFHEKDGAYYYMLMSRTKTGKFITITVECATTSEVRYIRTDRPMEQFKVFRPREHGVLYFVLHGKDKFYIVTNQNAINFKIMEAPESAPSEKNWRELLPHREDVAIDVSDPNAWVEEFENHLVVYERGDAQGRVRVIDLRDGSSHLVKFPEKMFFVTPLKNQDRKVNKARIKYWSYLTPTSIYEYDLDKRRLGLRKRDVVRKYDPSKYRTERILTTAKDGTEVPISLVYRKGLKKNGKNPAYLYAYGAYGSFELEESKFNSNILSLLDRGFVYAFAHIRGGSDMSRKWHEQSKMLTKINSFTDFIGCAEHLIKKGYTSKGLLAVRGGSAGGLLMGAVTNMRPDLFKAVIAEVPYVDAVTTMLDPSIPMTEGEFEEWGNPEDKRYYDYFKRYSPYDNVEAKDYPDLLVTAGLNDTKVGYWEPLKWAAKLRAKKTDDNLLLMKVGLVEGHHGAPGRYDTFKEYAFIYAFIMDRLGIKA